MFPQELVWNGYAYLLIQNGVWSQGIMNSSIWWKGVCMQPCNIGNLIFSLISLFVGCTLSYGPRMHIGDLYWKEIISYRQHGTYINSNTHFGCTGMFTTYTCWTPFFGTHTWCIEFVSCALLSNYGHLKIGQRSRL